jgi:hypothetical protein
MYCTCLNVVYRSSVADLICSGEPRIAACLALFIVCWCAGKHGGVGIRQRPLLFRICTFIYGLLVCRETRGCWDQTETSIVQDMHFYLLFAGV